LGEDKMSNSGDFDNSASYWISSPWTEILFPKQESTFQLSFLYPTSSFQVFRIFLLPGGAHCLILFHFFPVILWAFPLCGITGNNVMSTH
jgi:hypothetical protein